MSELILKSTNSYPLHDLVEAALENQERLVRAGAERTRSRLDHFESLYATTSQEFVRRYENDEWEETLDSIEWLGEIRMYEQLNTKLRVLRDISIEN